jgi:molybdopterin converting factor subunit 1
MQIEVKFFAVLREQAGAEHVSLQVDDGTTVSVAVEQLGKRFPSIRALLPRVAFAVNRAYAKPDVKLGDGAELALIPPVSGG